MDKLFSLMRVRFDCQLVWIETLLSTRIAHIRNAGPYLFPLKRGGKRVEHVIRE